MKFFTKYFLSSIFIFLFVFCNSTFAAQTDIYGGVISQDTTWTKDGSPYIIYAPAEVIIGESTSTDENTGEIIIVPIYAPPGPIFTVGAGTILTIEAGTIVKFDYGESMTVFGRLVVNGTSDEKVYFTSLYDDTTGGDTDEDDGIIYPYNTDWAGIQVIDGGSVELNNSDISYADTAIFLDSSKGQLNNTDILNCQDGIIVNASSLDINNSNIKDLNGDGIVAVFSSLLNIENSNIENISGDAFFLYLSSSLSIKNSTINNVSGNGFNLNNNSNLILKNSSIDIISGNTLDAYSSSTANITNSNLSNLAGKIETFENSVFSLVDSKIINFESRLELFNNSTSTIINSQIENVTGNPALEIFDGSYLSFSNSILKNISSIAIEAFSSDWNDYGTTTLIISSSTISDGNDIGLQLFGSKLEANISKTIIKNFASDGIQAYSYPTVSLKDSEVSNNGDNGIQTYANSNFSIKNTNILNNVNSGILIFSNSNVLIEDSKISNNDNGIESWGANMEIKNSIISDNATYGITNNPIESGAPSILAINNWWGDKSGPFNVDSNASGTANGVTSNVEFSPWLLDLPGTKPKCCSNVMFIPGLEASRLYRPDYNGGTKRLWEPEDSKNNSDIYLEVDGVPSREDIYTKDVIDSAYVVKKGNIYASFISSMNKMKSDKLINDWKAIPYDWRLSFDELLNNGREFSDGRIYYSGVLSTTSNPYILSELRRLASSSATGKVTIVAHSNGGLLSKAITNKLGEEASKLIDQIIFVAVPQVGTPQAIGSLLHGFDEGLPMKFFATLFSPTQARELGVNMSSAYNLIPSSQYFNYVSEPVITFDNSALLTSWRAKYGNFINTGEGLYNFLSDQSREILATKSDLVSLPTLNKNLYDSATALHDLKIDNWTPPENIQLTEIAGWGEETLSGIEYYQGIKTECINNNSFSSCPMYVKTPILEYNPKTTFDGDGTVLVPSALWTATSTGVEKYWVDLNDYKIFLIRGSKHADILEVPELNDFIKNIVVQGTSSLPKYISTSTPVNSKLGPRLQFTLHSPLSLDLYDSQGNHTGISTSTGEIEENILGSNYLIFGEVKYISVPASSTIYVSMNGYSSGSFTLNIEESQNGVVVASTTFAGVPSSTSTIATINIPDGNIASTSELIVDINGDGKSEINLLPILGEIVTPDLPKNETQKVNVTYSFGGGGWPVPVYSYTKLATTTFKLEDKKENVAILLLKPNKKENNKISPVKSIVNKNNKSTSTKILGENKSLVASVGSVSVADKILSTISNIITYIGKLINKIFFVI